MQNELNYVQLLMVRQQFTKKSHAEIAELLEMPVAFIAEVVEKLAKNSGIISYQSKLDSKATKQNKVVKAKKLKADEAKLIGRQVELASEQNRRKSREPLFANKVVDYSQLIPVRVDAKTTIYAKPGDDIEALKRQCLARIGKSREIAFAPVQRTTTKSVAVGHFETKATKSKWLD